jgi:hypothetical protein
LPEEKKRNTAQNARAVAHRVIKSILVVLLVTACGTLATYLYDRTTTLAARVCAGTCIGIASLGLVGFIFAALIGLHVTTLLMVLVVLSMPALLALRDQKRRDLIAADLHATSSAIREALLNPRRIPKGVTIFYVLVVIVLWRCFQRAMLELPDGIHTGLLNNYGDLPFHISVITSFVYGHNFLPEDPTYAGVFFTYPFLTDFVSALFVYCGASLRQSMFLENFVVGVAFVGLLQNWARVLLPDRLAALITPLLVLLNGGLGWIFFFTHASVNHGLLDYLRNLPSSFTIIPDTTWRWGNAMSTLLIPQRGFLLGLPLAVIVFTEWWRSGEPETPAETGKKAKRKTKEQKKQQALEEAEAAAGGTHSFLALTPSVRRMIAAGIIAGLIPLVHAHSFVAVMMVGAGIALLERRWRDWFCFFLTVSVVALPQLWWSTHHTAVQASTFFEFHFGWDRGNENIVWFWFRNSGLFIPLTVAALLWGGRQRLVSRRLLCFFLPFTLCFIVPNLVKLAPWVWDNIKVLFYWWLGSAPIIALLLARLWREGLKQRVAAVLLFVSLTLAGAFDVAAIMIRPTKFQIFDSTGIAFAEMIKQRTEPRALVLHAPVHNHPVFLTGRRSLMGYPGHIWTHGLEFAPRQIEIKRIYNGSPDAFFIMRRYNFDYIVVSPLERNSMTVNNGFFSNFEMVGEVGGYRLYKTRQP